MLILILATSKLLLKPIKVYKNYENVKIKILKCIKKECKFQLKIEYNESTKMATIYTNEFKCKCKFDKK